jgi:putative acetyltransferase
MSERIPAPVHVVPAEGRVLPVEAGAVIGSHAGVVLRHARDADADRIVALVATVWSQYPDKILDAPNDMPELLAPASAYAEADGRFWVVEAGGQIIGTVALAPSDEDGVVELQKMYVAQGFRRNGLGTFLCGLVDREARLRGAHAIELWSDVKLHDAHRHYQRVGYVRGTAVRHVDDLSRTVQYYYRKELAHDAAGNVAVGAASWRILVRSLAARGAMPLEGAEA